MDFLAQLPPSLPDDPVAAAVSWQALIFLVGAFLCFSGIVAIALKARSTINAMIEKANRDVVSGLSRVEHSVNELAKEVANLLRRDGITDAAMRGMEQRIYQVEKKQDGISERLSQVEGRMSRG